MKIALMAGTSPFAHLLGRRAATGKKAGEGDDKKDDKEMKSKAKNAEDGDGTTEGDDVEDVVDDATDEGEDEVTDGGEGDGSEDEDEEIHDENEVVDTDKKDAKGKGTKGKAGGKAAAAAPKTLKEARIAGRRAERARCAAIFKSPHAGINPAAAAHLAFETSMSAENAIGTLAAFVVQAPDAKGGSGLRTRISNNPDVGTGDGGDGKPSMAAQIIAAGKKRRGEA